MNKITRISGILAALLILLSLIPLSQAQAQSAPTDFDFENFAGTYYLGRDSKGVANLLVQEDMIVDFPANGSLYGLKRTLPTTYQGHNLDLKIISVTDAAGVPVNYHTSKDNQDNQVITTGDPSIALIGPQTFRIKYQTSSVVSINYNEDEFLVDVNGRDWQETFGSVKAFIEIDKNFASSLIGKPTCYIGYQNQQINACTVSSQKSQSSLYSTLITSATTQQLGPHEGLVVKLDFKKGTFNQKSTFHHSLVFIIGVAAATTLVLLAIWLFWFRRHKKK